MVSKLLIHYVFLVFCPVGWLIRCCVRSIVPYPLRCQAIICCVGHIQTRVPSQTGYSPHKHWEYSDVWND